MQNHQRVTIRAIFFEMFFHSIAVHSGRAAQHTSPSPAQHSPPPARTAHYQPGQHSTAQHSTAQHGTAQHSTAQHSTAQQQIDMAGHSMHYQLYSTCII